MKRFLAVLLVVIMLSGCGPRHQLQEMEQSPAIDDRTVMPTSADGIYQGEKLPYYGDIALQVQIVDEWEIDSEAEHESFVKEGEPLILHFSGGQNLVFLAVTEVSADEEEIFYYHFRVDNTRKEAYLTLKDFEPGQVPYQFRYQIDGDSEQTAYLHKDETGEVFLSRSRNLVDGLYADAYQIRQLITDKLEPCQASDYQRTILRGGDYELWYEAVPGALTIFDGRWLRYYDLNLLFEEQDPAERWGRVHTMIQDGRLTFLVEYTTEPAWSGVQNEYEQYERSGFGVRNFAASFDLATGDCLAVQKLKRGKIAFVETDGDMLYFCHTDIDPDTHLYNWDLASFNTGEFVFVHTAAGSFEGDALLRLDGMELLPGGSIKLTGLDAYHFGKEVTLTVDLKAGSYTRSPEADPSADKSHPLRVCGIYQIGGPGVGSGYSILYCLQHDGTFVWRPSSMGYASPEAVSTVAGRAGTWRLEGEEIIFTTMLTEEIVDGVLQEPMASSFWQLDGEVQSRPLSPDAFIVEAVPFRVLDPNGVFLTIDGQLYTYVYADVTEQLYEIYNAEDKEGQMMQYVWDMSRVYDTWADLQRML